MTDEDLTTLNNIMLGSDNTLLTVMERSQYDEYEFVNPKSFYDVCLAILVARQVSNTKLNDFYTFASSQGFSYTPASTNDDILWVGSAR
jgi:hypothetical protein